MSGMHATQLGAQAQRVLDLAARTSGKALTAVEQEVFAALQARLDTLLEHLEATRILNAGCGRGIRCVPVAEACFVVGIDIEAPPNETKTDIDELLVGDIETYDFGPRRFEAVYCWDVLEHVRNPRRALLNLVSALEPGGLLIVGLPHASSIKGLITRFTPHWVHAWAWRHLLPAATSEPFPTVLSPAVRPRAIQAFAREQALNVEFYSEYEAWPQKKLRMMLGLTGRAFSIVSSIVHVLSLGRVTATATDVVIVLRKPG